jgi:hypothetical protein
VLLDGLLDRTSYEGGSLGKFVFCLAGNPPIRTRRLDRSDRAPNVRRLLTSTDEVEAHSFSLHLDFNLTLCTIIL